MNYFAQPQAQGFPPNQNPYGYGVAPQPNYGAQPGMQQSWGMPPGMPQQHPPGFNPNMQNQAAAMSAQMLQQQQQQAAAFAAASRGQQNPQQGYQQPQQLQYDYALVRTVLNQLTNELRIQNVPPEVVNIILTSMDPSQPQNAQNIQRLMQIVMKYFIDNKIDPTKSIPTPLLTAAIQPWLGTRVPGIIQRLQQMQAQSPTQSMFAQPNMGAMQGMQPGYGGMPPQQGWGMPQANPYAGWSSMGQPQQPMGNWGAPMDDEVNYSDGWDAQDAAMAMGGSAPPAQPAPQPMPQQPPRPAPKPQPMPSYGNNPMQMPDASVFDTVHPTPAPTPVDEAPRQEWSRIDIRGTAVQEWADDPVDTRVLEILDDHYLEGRITDADDTRAVGGAFQMKRTYNNMDDAITFARQGIPDQYLEGEYLHTINFEELKTIQIPTSDFLNMQHAVVTAYNKDKDWTALLKVMDDTKHAHAKIIDKFLTRYINQYLRRYFREINQPQKVLKIDSLFDLEDLMGGEFGEPFKSIPGWKDGLRAIMGRIIEVFFVEQNLLKPTDESLGDMVKCRDVQLVFNGLTKYDLAWVDTDTRNRFVDAIFDKMTILRVPRCVAVTNTLTADEARRHVFRSTKENGLNEHVFWSLYKQQVEHQEQKRIEAIVFVKGTSWSLTADNVLSTRLVAAARDDRYNAVPIMMSPAYFGGAFKDN